MRAGLYVHWPYMAAAAAEIRFEIAMRTFSRLYPLISGKLTELSEQFNSTLEIKTGRHFERAAPIMSI